MSDISNKLTSKPTAQNLGFGANSNANVAAINEDRKETVMVFSKQGVYLGMKIVEAFDQETGKYRPPQPRVTCTIGGKFVNLPLDGEFWTEFSAFVDKFAEAMKGQNFERATVIDDVDKAKRLLAPFKK